MAKKPPMQDVFERNQFDLMNAVKRSRSWYDKQVLELTKQQLTPKKVLNGDASALTKTIIPGHLYMYAYDPKTKEDLPYYDRFPLVFPFRKTSDGFYGLNMHYLPYVLRMQLLDNLLAFKSNSRFDETTRIKYSWAMIDGISKFKAAQPCVKQYLNSQMRSQFRHVDSNDWATAMLLPVEQFVGASKQKVWEESRRKIRKL